MKGDYSQPGLMPGRYLEQIDLPSPYLVYAEVVSGGRYNFRQGGAPFRTGLYHRPDSCAI